MNTRLAIPCGRHFIACLVGFIPQHAALPEGRCLLTGIVGQKHQYMYWAQLGAHFLLQVQTQRLHHEFRSMFECC